jgi:hypothetical protein
MRVRALGRTISCSKYRTFWQGGDTISSYHNYLLHCNDHTAPTLPSASESGRPVLTVWLAGHHELAVPQTLTESNSDRFHHPLRRRPGSPRRSIRPVRTSLRARCAAAGGRRRGLPASSSAVATGMGRRHRRSRSRPTPARTQRTTNGGLSQRSIGPRWAVASSQV